MNIEQMASGLLVRCGHVGVRPNGLTVALNRNNWMQMLGKKGWEPARFRLGDLVAEDWDIVALPADAPAPSERKC